MRTVEDDLSEMPGQDSFLDVLTNMVGIIILLLVVVALRTSQATIREAVDQVRAQVPTQKLVTHDEIEAAKRSAAEAELDVKGIVQQAVSVHGEALLRDHERDNLTTFVAAFEEELNARRAALSADKQRDYDLRRKLAESQLTLDNLGRERVALLTQPAETKAIENQPTPIARRMTGKELILYLSGGHVAVIPEQIFNDMIEDVKANLWRLRNDSNFTSTVGPVNGFRLRYKVGMVSVQLPGQSDRNLPGSPKQFAMMVRPELIWYEILPVSSILGDPVTMALAPDSELRQVLKEHPPLANTVMIVVYPDSIPELHELKRELYAGGYATVDIPRPMGKRLRCSITAGRSGEYFAQ